MIDTNFRQVLDAIIADKPIDGALVFRQGPGVAKHVFSFYDDDEPYDGIDDFMSEFGHEFAVAVRLEKYRYRTLEPMLADRTGRVWFISTAGIFQTADSGSETLFHLAFERQDDALAFAANLSVATTSASE